MKKTIFCIFFLNKNLEKKKMKGSKRKININGDILEITPYGAGSEVGRSCIVLSFKGKTIMVKY